MTGWTYLPLLVAAVASFFVDALALPRGGWRRPTSAVLLHLTCVGFIACVALALTRRPIACACVVLAFPALMAAVSNAKYASLREPFVFTDLSLFAQAVAHPRLYLPFLKISTILGAVSGVLILIFAFTIERALPVSVAPAALGLAIACVVIAYGLATMLPLSLDPAKDQTRCGFLPVFIAYLLNGWRPSAFRAFERVASVGPYVKGERPHATPDVIVIQSESFFDVRTLPASIHGAVLSHYDAACRECVVHGDLRVPAWGANTMRSEFALLTGLRASQLGYARFYPYAFVRRHCPSLAGWFRRAGYATTAIHPYFADFFGRNRVFPLLQFDRFVSIDAFKDASRAGPYVSDAAVLDRIIAELETPRTRPSFIFAMTMENHGPLHLETVEPGEASRYHAMGDDPEWQDLTVYLRHLANANAMLGRLLEYLRTRGRDTILCFYGDHVPALPKVFDRLGGVSGHSNYFIWRNFGDRPALRKLETVDLLGAAMLRVMESAARQNPVTAMSRDIA
jgi:hypothetical protein